MMLELNRPSQVMPPNSELVAALDQLESALPKLVTDYPDEGDFWDAFASKANPISDGAMGSAAAAYAQGRLLAMLRTAGLLPDDEEPLQRT